MTIIIIINIVFNLVNVIIIIIMLIISNSSSSSYYYEYFITALSIQSAHANHSANILRTILRTVPRTIPRAILQTILCASPLRSDAAILSCSRLFNISTCIVMI